MNKIMCLHLKECFYSVILGMSAVIRISLHFIVDQYMVPCKKNTRVKGLCSWDCAV